MTGDICVSESHENPRKLLLPLRISSTSPSSSSLLSYRKLALSTRFGVVWDLDIWRLLASLRTYLLLPQLPPLLVKLHLLVLQTALVHQLSPLRSSSLVVHRNISKRQLWWHMPVNNKEEEEEEEEEETLKQKQRNTCYVIFWRPLEGNRVMIGFGRSGYDKWRLDTYFSVDVILSMLQIFIYGRRMDKSD